MNAYEVTIDGKVYTIPGYMMEGLELYIAAGVEPGGFLERVLCNDLVGAFSKADSHNQRNLIAYASYLYNEAPSKCWGSQSHYDNWIKKGGF